MFLAEEAAQTAGKFSGFDPFVVLFTIVILVAIVRLIRAPKKNVFAILFSLAGLGVFLIMDAVMVLGWMGKL